MRTVFQTVIFGKLMKVSHFEKQSRSKPTQTSGHVNTQIIFLSAMLLLSSNEIIIKTYLENKK